MFKATVLIDNIAAGELISEWGFCVFVSCNGKNYLLDTGSSDKYMLNALKLGIDLGSVDVSVLSHAHFDHSGGYVSFFRKNKKAPLYILDSCGEDCYFKLGPIRRYIGIPKKLTERFGDRIVRVEGFTQLDEGVWLVPHLENGLEAIGKKAHLYRKQDGKFAPDSFCHEQSLVFDTDKGLVVLNSCSHGGLQNILADLEHYLPGKRIYMTIGGLHLSKYSKAEVREIAEIIKSLGIERVVTGHCTGDGSFEVLKEVLGDAVTQTSVGTVIEL